MDPSESTVPIDFYSLNLVFVPQDGSSESEPVGFLIRFASDVQKNDDRLELFIVSRRENCFQLRVYRYCRGKRGR